MAVGVGGVQSPSDVHVRVSSWRAGNSVHPTSTPTPPPPRIEYREVKHFRKWFPWLVPSFVAANTVMLVVTMYVNDCPRNSLNCIASFLGRFSFQPFKENPLLGPSSTTLLKMGALEVSKVEDKHHVWLLITCIWLHGGVFHLLANMLSLLAVGIRLEQEFGFVRIGLLYIISGVGGSLLSALFLQSSISVGASGAVFGLLGGMLSELIINWTIYVNKIATLVTLLAIILINLAVGIFPHVDNFAHIGGFITGFLLGFVFLIRPQFGWITQRHAPAGHLSSSVASKFKKYQLMLWIISLIILIAWLTAGMIMVLRGLNANNYCKWCHYLSCVPTSKWSCKTSPASCLTEQMGSQLNLTCSADGKSGMYTLPGATTSQIQSLCSQLCN
ncbi:hypothetical protein MLD38_026512 [Melastoma candidum]|uniref:Uncharacterized protein n=1 Tax=Melastoma candidum TaxID=119954 RepID=A0ACB9NYN7_9MYRT|nr:hypothetical protein MLD38_026512 [Melastoma candidum]